MEDSKILDLIKNDENKAFKYLYNTFKKTSYGIMSKKGLYGKNEQNDVYQESIMALLILVRKSTFKITCRLKTLFISIIINQTLKTFRLKNRFSDEIYDGDYLFYDLEKEYIKEEINLILHNELNSDDMNILKLMYIDGKTQKEIAKEIGYSNADSIKSRKCKLIKRLKTKLTLKYKPEELKYYKNA